ncbi:hypothetical protein D7X33_35685 [Butyricicoccus sp. 1XD8-22]|nr:hypothetical protein D7X33_35685 [Butyricicoccus sp. 1XD8-22]
MAFKKGNIVKIKFGHPMYISGNSGMELKDMNSEDVGELAVIEYSYGEKYGNGEVGGGYSIVYMKNGLSRAWLDDWQLEFVSEGSEELIQETKELAEENKKMKTDLKWIKEHWNSDELSYGSFLKLFEEIGLKSAIERTGEFIHLHDEIETVRPLLNSIMSGNNIEIETLIDKIFKIEFKEKFLNNSIALSNKLQRI